MVDTLTFDKTYAFHNHFFIQYDESLPDTVSLKDKAHTYPGIQLGHEESRKYAIMEFTYIKGAIIPGNDISQERILPDYYKLSVFESGERKRRYFLKDSISGKLNEVDRELLFPDSGIREVN